MVDGRAGMARGARGVRVVNRGGRAAVEGANGVIVGGRLVKVDNVIEDPAEDPIAGRMEEGPDGEAGGDSKLKSSKKEG